MTRLSDFVVQLRHLADTIEQADLPAEASVSVDMSVHWIKDRATLRQWCQIMNERDAWSRNGTHSVSGKVTGVETHLYYSAGLLGRAKKVKIVEQEDGQDLDGLLRGEEIETVTA